MDLLKALKKARNEHQLLEEKDQTIIGLCFQGEKLQIFELSFSDEEGPWFSAVFSEGLIGSYDGCGEVYGEGNIEDIAKRLSSEFPNVTSLSFFVCKDGFQEHTTDHVLEYIFEELPNYDVYFPNDTDKYLTLSKQLVEAKNHRK